MEREKLDLEKVVSELASTNFNEKEVSFAGRGLKLDSEDDAEVVVRAVKECAGMTGLCLEGNTVGCEAAKAIAKALEGQSKLKRALWKDMFTGRLKNEIPKALNYLTGGVMLAGAQLVELDLSDNAFGPIGVQGISCLISSHSCHTLQELRLNNNGLGPSGGKILAQALEDCLKSSRSEGGPTFTLRIFVCGRNRLENEGAQALSTVFRELKTLEEVSMPQNGIYHPGISAIAGALSHNPELKILNLNDNTFTEDGAMAFSTALRSLQKLEVINFGDCLVRSRGASYLCEALRDSHQLLREFHLNNNEIGKEEGIAIAEAMENKPNFQCLELNGNSFGREGCEMIEGVMEAIGKGLNLGSLSDDEGEDEEEDEDEYRESDEQESEITRREMDDGDAFVSPMRKQIDDDVLVTPDKFYTSPSLKALIGLGNDDEREKLLLSALGDHPTLDQYVEAFVKIASVADDDDIARRCCDAIMKNAFAVAERDKSLPVLTNTLLVHLGLIKCEDKTFRVASNLSGVLCVLEHSVRQPYFDGSTVDTLQFFLSLPNRQFPAKDLHSLLRVLYQR